MELQENGLEKVVEGDLISKMESLQADKIHPRSASPEMPNKVLQHCVKTECLYTSECLSMNYKLEKLVHPIKENTMENLGTSPD